VVALLVAFVQQLNLTTEITSDVVLESGSVLKSDSSPYFEDSDRLGLGLKPTGLGLGLGLEPQDSELDSKSSGLGLSTV